MVAGAMTMRTDVFFRQMQPQPKIRMGMTFTCLYRWEMQADANLRIIAPENPATFHISSKRFADDNATTDPYIIADDDCLPIGRDFVESGVRTLLEHPAYGLLAATSISDGFAREVADGPLIPPSIIERHAVGGICFVRRGVLSEMKWDYEIGQTDAAICEEIARRGFKTGILPRVKMNHLGAGYSLTAKEYWSA